MTKYQKLAFLFLFLGVVFLAGGLLLQQVVTNALLFGLLLATLSQVTSLFFGLLWYLSTRKKDEK